MNYDFNSDFCRWRLYKIGDPKDIEIMWEAKYINMDTGSGFDIQNLVGAGVDGTLTFLRDNNLAEIVEDIEGYLKCGYFELLDEWSTKQEKYFYRKQS